MHVGLNLVFLVPGYTGGTETYARELIPALAAAAPGTRFTAFASREAAADAAAPWNRLIDCVTVPVEARNRVQWVRGEQLLLPRLAARAGIDVLHSLANTAPGWSASRRVVTIHDLHHRLVPEAHLGLLGLGMRVLVPLAARRAHRVLAVSAATGRDVQRLLKVPENRIDVVPHGLGTTGAPPPLPEAELRARHDLRERPIVLCVAAKRPHKNLGRLIGALALIPGERRPVLVLVGYATAHQDELEQRAAHLAVTGDVRFLDWVAQDELEGLYAIAAAFVLPSLHEGFGLPVLEAMARGVPVACSARGALAEVAGDAALTFDPMSEPAIAAAIERLIGDRAEAARLREAGRARAATFSWEAAARGTLDCYARALS